MSDIEDKFLRRFQTNPADPGPFKSLEEHFYLGKNWTALVTLYAARAQAITDRDEAAGLLQKAAEISEKRLGKPEQALSLLERALKASRSSGPIRRDLVQRYRDGGQPRKAAELIEQELRTAPLATKRAMTLEAARTWAAAGEVGRATSLLREQLDAAPQDLELPGALAKWLDLARATRGGRWRRGCGRTRRDPATSGSSTA